MIYSELSIADSKRWVPRLLLAHLVLSLLWITPCRFSTHTVKARSGLHLWDQTSKCEPPICNGISEASNYHSYLQTHDQPAQATAVQVHCLEFLIPWMNTLAAFGTHAISVEIRDQDMHEHVNPCDPPAD
jgi:hypothetical protein